MPLKRVVDDDFYKELPVQSISPSDAKNKI
jgi:hypothetical protein